MSDAVKRFVQMPPDYLLNPSPGVDREAIIRERRETEYVSALADELVKQRARREAKRILDSEECGDGDDIPDPTLLTDFLDEDDEADVAWRVEGLWPLGAKVILAAGAKAGKTTSTGNIVRSLVDGDRLFRVFPTTPLDDGIVVVLDFEMPRKSLRRWLRDQGIRNKAKLAVWTERGKAGRFDLRLPDVRARWVAKLRKVDARIWVIDCLSPILAALGIGENDNTEVGRILNGITAAAVEAGVEEVLLIHHMGHQAERSRGASALQGWPDILWKITRERNDKNPNGEPDTDAPRFFSAYGRDVDVKEGRLLFDPASRHLTFAEGGRKQSEQTDALGRVLVWVRDNPDQTSSAVEAALTGKGVGRNVARAAIGDAKTRGYILADGVGGRGKPTLLRITAIGLSALRSTSGDETAMDRFADVADEVYCTVCQAWVDPYRVTQGHRLCRPCEIGQEAA